MATKVDWLRSLWRRVPSRRRDPLGRRGEDAAARALRRRGYEILERGFRCRRGEIDIVAREADVLAIVEVKSRTAGWVRSPVDAVDADKQRRLVRLARVWLALPRNRHYADAPVRFDVVGVTFDDGPEPSVEILRGAFDASRGSL